MTDSNYLVYVIEQNFREMETLQLYKNKDKVSKDMRIKSYRDHLDKDKKGITEYTFDLVHIPENSENKYTLTTIVKDTTTALWIGPEFQTAQQEGETFYTDNWELKLISS